MKTTKRFIVLLFWAALYILCLASCSASWHVRQAMKKDPGIFETRIDTVEVKPGAFEIDCDSLFRAASDTDEFILFVETPIIQPDGTKTIDSAKIKIVPEYRFITEKLSHEDSIKVAMGTLTNEDSMRIYKRLLNIEVDCPDCETKTEIITLKPTLWEKLKYSAWGAIPLLVVLFLIFFNRRR